MYLQSIKLKNFRNIESTNLSFSSNFNVISGNNGNGKTNLLEAIYYLTNLVPIRDRKLKQLIHYNKDYLNIDANFSRNEVIDNININIKNNNKVINYNGNKNNNIANYLSNFKSILFTPDDLMIIKGAPELRRKYFNKAIFQIYPSYFFELSKYKRILKERNTLLKDLAIESNKTKLELLNIINYQFSESAVKIFNIRKEYLKNYFTYFKNAIKELFNKNLELSYKTSSSYESIDRFLNNLKLNSKNELLYKRTLSGPHLDDYTFMVEGREAKSFSSQGEMRIIVLALKISQILYIYDKTKLYPVLILDDITSELDDNRKNLLFKFLEHISGQVFISSTSTQHIPDLNNKKKFYIENGIIL